MNVCFYVDHLNVPLSNEPLKTNNDAGSEINFFREAPAGQMKKCGCQKETAKHLNAYFFKMFFKSQIPLVIKTLKYCVACKLV